MAVRRAKKTAGEATEPGFEDILLRLQQLVEKLEEGDLPLETAVALFEEGVQLSQLGAKRLDEAELKVEQLLADVKGVKTKPMEGRAASEP